jgi:nucleotide-binding universal stress UspA family protein
VLTAIEYAAIPMKVWRDAHGRIEPVRRAMMGRADDVTGRAVAQLEESGIAAEAVIKIDDPRFVIVREAEGWPADLIFIRAHSYTELSRWLLGMKILFATDGSEFSRLAAQSVAARPWPSETQVKVLSVVEPLVRLITRADNSLEEDRSEVDIARAAVKEAEDLIGGAGLTVISDAAKGDPKEQITMSAKAWSADLAVVGSHGRRGLKRWLLGSVSEAVARHASCSVEVIRKTTSS